MPKKNAVILLIITTVLIVIGFKYFYSDPELNLVENVTDSSKSINVPEGWQIYTDEGLGYGFAYPKDWKLSMYSRSTPQERQERVELKSGNALILIDPLGRTGSIEFSSPIQKNIETINGIQWQATFWPEGDYYRYTDVNTALKLEVDPTTDGNPSPSTFNQPYTTRNSFRAHLYLENVNNQQEKDAAIKTIQEILNTLKTI